MPFFYQSGEQVKQGDRVRLHNEPGEVEFVADDDVEANRQHIEAHGKGVMIREAKVFGRLFIAAPDFSEYEDLEFVARSD